MSEQTQVRRWKLDICECGLVVHQPWGTTGGFHVCIPSGRTESHDPQPTDVAELAPIVEGLEEIIGDAPVGGWAYATAFNLRAALSPTDEQTRPQDD